MEASEWPDLVSEERGDVCDQNSPAPRLDGTPGTPGTHPDRTLHLIDIENLAGSGLPTPGPCEPAAIGLYRKHVGVGETDHVVVACNHLLFKQQDSAGSMRATSSARVPTARTWSCSTSSTMNMSATASPT